MFALFHFPFGNLLWARNRVSDKKGQVPTFDVKYIPVGTGMSYVQYISDHQDVQIVSLGHYNTDKNS